MPSSTDAAPPTAMKDDNGTNIDIYDDYCHAMLSIVDACFFTIKASHGIVRLVNLMLPTSLPARLTTLELKLAAPEFSRAGIATPATDIKQPRERALIKPPYFRPSSVLHRLAITVIAA